jgi:hypothetical protein
LNDDEVGGMIQARYELNKYKRPKPKRIPIIQPKRNR